MELTITFSLLVSDWREVLEHFKAKNLHKGPVSTYLMEKFPDTSRLTHHYSVYLLLIKDFRHQKFCNLLPLVLEA